MTPEERARAIIAEWVRVSMKTIVVIAVWANAVLSAAVLFGFPQAHTSTQIAALFGWVLAGVYATKDAMSSEARK